MSRQLFRQILGVASSYEPTQDDIGFLDGVSRFNPSCAKPKCKGGGQIEIGLNQLFLGHTIARACFAPELVLELWGHLCISSDLDEVVIKFRIQGSRT